MEHVHFGAGYFGLGFVVHLAGAAGLRSVIVNRGNSSTNPQKRDTITPVRRLALLAANTEYFIQYSGRNVGSFETTEYKKFIEYPKGANEHLQVLKELTSPDSMLVTCSLGSVEGYDVVGALVAEAAIERYKKGAQQPLYVIACENEIKTVELAERIKGAFMKAGSGHTLESLNIVPVEAVVDRVCTKFSEDRPGATPDKSRLVVHGEPFARLVLEERAGLAALKAIFGGMSPTIVFSAEVEIEKTRKRYLVNGAHALAAICAHHYSYRDIDVYYGETDVAFAQSVMYGIGPEPRERQAFLSELLEEFSEAFKEAAGQVATGSQYLASEYTPAEEARYLGSIARRFTETPDTVLRVLSSFQGPPSHGANSLLDFLRHKASVRILEPFVLYMIRKQKPPARMAEGIDMMVKATISRNYPV